MRNDETPEGDTPRQKAISIHSLRVEGDLQPMQKCGVLHDFNPLPPCGGRLPAGMMAGNASYFNPLPPCGGRPLRRICGADQQRISIHSLRVEGDVRGLHEPLISQISIHSLRVEGDRGHWHRILHGKDFNPLPPCGGRRRTAATLAMNRDFNPLPPCGGRPIPFTTLTRSL